MTKGKTPMLEAEAPPLRRDESGALRVGSSRVLFELVIRAFQDGATAETIVQRYGTLTLADVYGSIAYYLRHRASAEAYLAEREAAANETQKKIQATQTDLTEMRRRLIGRKSA